MMRWNPALSFAPSASRVAVVSSSVVMSSASRVSTLIAASLRLVSMKVANSVLASSMTDLNFSGFHALRCVRRKADAPQRAMLRVLLHTTRTVVQRPSVAREPSAEVESSA